MNRLVRALPGSFLLLTCAVVGIAQDVSPTPEAKKKDKDAPRVYRRYEKSRDETITETRSIPVFGSILGGLDMNVYYTYQGKSLSTPESVSITFISSDPEHQHRRELVIKADDQVYNLGTMEYRKIADSFSQAGITGKLSLSIPVESFKQIAGARKVHIELGIQRFDLEERHLKKLRGLAAAMGQ